MSYDPNAFTMQLIQSLGQQIGQGYRNYQEQAILQDILPQLQNAQDPEEIMRLILQMQGQPGLSAETRQRYAQLAPIYAGQAKTAQAQQLAQQQAMEKQQTEQEKLIREQIESALLAKVQRGEELTPQESMLLSPTSLRTLIGREKPTFEPTEEKLEAERVSKLADTIESDYQASQSEALRLNRMEQLSKSGELSTPLMVKTLNTLGLPIGVLGNPNTEEFQKLEADFLRDVRNVFPGGRITNYEIQTYLRTVPSLMNSSAGRESIIKTRRFLNEAKQIKYDAYKEILKENKGVKPRNLGLLLEERIGQKLVDLEDKFRGEMEAGSESFQVPIPMVDPQGRRVNIPPGKVQSALEAGARFA